MVPERMSEPSPWAYDLAVVGESEAWLETVARARRIAKASCGVLLTGETGTGKELIARIIHQGSTQTMAKPFVAINCSAIPAELFESELFGHAKGAFTGAESMRKGAFRTADRGVLLLDDVAELPRPLQAKLLRALQEGVVHPVGSDETWRVKVRVIASTNRPLKGMVARGQFRADLYYRLDEARVWLPPLRDRGPEEIRRLALHFMERYPGATLTENAIAVLQSCLWEGNVRELENAIRGMVADLEDGRGEIRKAAAEARVGQGTAEERLVDAMLGMTLADLERAVILRTLELDPNRTTASRKLGIDVRTIRDKLNRYRAEGYDVPSSKFSRSGT